MAYKEKDTKKWTAQWFETNAKGEKKRCDPEKFSKIKTETAHDTSKEKACKIEQDPCFEKNGKCPDFQSDHCHTGIYQEKQQDIPAPYRAWKK